MEVDTSNIPVNGQIAANVYLADIGEINEEFIKSKTKKDLKGKAAAAIKILRSFIISNDYEAAERFVSSVKLPESATNNDWARWFYYLGLIEAMKGINLNNYKTAKKYFEIALRKAPTNGAIGFKQEVNKWMVLVMLLIGEIPERSLFRAKEFEKVLLPYMRLTKVVKLGDVEVEDAHDTVMKVFKEGILRGMVVTNDPEFKNQPYVKFGEADDQYRGTEPQIEFDKRIKELLDLHSHAVKALRYPDNANPEVETIEEQRKREQEALEAAADEEDDDMIG
uniref:26S proteasome regulatory subunit C-terminal domain-containing protein n=1 Tax=Meloidogyne javanica TaxID=6303 RepID=A0A915M8N1_MELJA